MTDATHLTVPGPDRTLPGPAQDYLARLRASVTDLPSDIGEDVVADLRAHVVEALAADRPIEQVLRSLGPADQVANEVRESLASTAGLGTLREPGGAARGPDRTPASVAARSRTGLCLAAVLLGLVTAVFTSFLLPQFGVGAGTPAAQSLIETYGLAFAAATLVPALVAGVALVVPLRRQPVVVAVSALVVTLVCLGAILVPAAGVALMWVPMAIVLWSAVIVPRRRLRERPRSVVARIAGTLVLALPAVMAVPALVTATIQLDAGTVAWIVISVVLALLYALGSRPALVAIVVVGAVAMVGGHVRPGMLSPVFWLVGGLWLTIGLTSLASYGWRLRRR